MTVATRRQFLGGIGSGMLALGLGPTLFSEVGYSMSLAEAGDKLDFGDLEPLVALMQEHGADQLMPVLVKKLEAGVSLETLVAAGALANARTHGGEDYNGYHAFMALAPSLVMSNRLHGRERPLPVLKVLHRNARFIQDAGGRSDEKLHTVEPAAHGSPDDVRAFERAMDMEAAERAYAAASGGTAAGAYDALQPVLNDDIDVHRIVLAWRAWDMIRLTGEEHAHTLLRQSVRFCVDREASNKKNGNPDPSLRVLLPHLLEQLTAKPAGTRQPTDDELEALGLRIFAADKDDGAREMAAALATFRRDTLGEALTLASNRLLLNDPGRTRGERGKPKGSVHGASVGVHASDSARAWRSLVATVEPHRRDAALLTAAYHTAGQSHRVRTDEFPWRAKLDELRTGDAKVLLGQLADTVEAGDQALAVAAVEHCGDAGVETERVLDLLLHYGTTQDGALHAEKYFSTVVEDLASARPAFRRRHLRGLARVTASEHGFPDPGYARAREVLGA
jgi:hypothetical protein